MDRSKILEEIFEVQSSMTQLWKQCFSVPMQKEGITFSQMGALMLLDDRQPLMGKELATYLGLTPSSITQLIESLVQAGCVTREQDTRDRRIVYLRLSKEGKRKVGLLKEKRKELFYKATEPLTEHELQADLARQKKMYTQMRAYVDGLQKS